ncbi:hypothetical protein M404DRAFT_20177, partial [Pisolithus tinctorius Marx 270]
MIEQLRAQPSHQTEVQSTAPHGDESGTDPDNTTAPYSPHRYRTDRIQKNKLSSQPRNNHRTTTNLPRRSQPRNVRGQFVSSRTPEITAAWSPLGTPYTSDYSFPSGTQSPDILLLSSQEYPPLSPQEYTSIRGIPPTRGNSPEHPEDEDFFTAFPMIILPTPPASSAICTTHRERANSAPSSTSIPHPPPRPTPQAPPLPPMSQPPPPPLLPQAPPPRPRPMAEAVPLFYGDRAETENVSDFLKAFNCSMLFLNPLATDEQKIKALANYLGTSSPAEH